MKLRISPLEDLAETPGVAKPDPILTVDGLVRRFGGLTAVDTEHLEIQRRTVTGLIGPNGAGKTTLFNLLTAFDQPDAGAWSFNGEPMLGLTAYQIARTGMVRTFQLTKVLPRLTVLENMKLGATRQLGERIRLAMFPRVWRRKEAEIQAQAEALLERFSLIDKRHQYAGTLSAGQRKLLEMGRALMADPELLMLDEPVDGVNPVLAETIIGHMRALRDEGRTVVFVAHDMDVVRTVSEWVVVMVQGHVVAEGSYPSVVKNQTVIDAYLGAHHDAPQTRSQTRPRSWALLHGSRRLRRNAPRHLVDAPR